MVLLCAPPLLPSRSINRRQIALRMEQAPCVYAHGAILTPKLQWQKYKNTRKSAERETTSIRIDRRVSCGLDLVHTDYNSTSTPATWQNVEEAACVSDIWSTQKVPIPVCDIPADVMALRTTSKVLAVVSRSRTHTTILLR